MPLKKLVWNGTDWDIFFGGLETTQPDNFVLGETIPTRENSGIPAGTTLTPYDSTGTLRTVTITADNTTFTDVDFGNVKVVVRAQNVSFIRCRWRITNSVSTAAIIYTLHSSVVNCIISQCDIINTDQTAGLNAVQGHSVTVYRNKIQGTVDGVNPTGGENVKIHGNYISDLSWFASSTNGVWHPSDTQTHNDCIQTTYAGAEIIGNFLGAYPSLTVGTGTPGSGSDTGNPSSEYTQVQAEARRTALMGSSWTPAAKTYDGTSRENGGVICPIMCNVATGSTAPNLTVTSNWFGGGTVGVNALATNLTSPLGTFTRNRFYADQKAQSGGKPVGFFVRSALTATIPTSGNDRNVWMDDQTTVMRINS